MNATAQPASAATASPADLLAAPGTAAPSVIEGLHLFPERSSTAFPEPFAGKRPIAVIGAGFSGTIATLQLLRRLPEDQPILLCERSADFARGVAYSTGENEHLLNVRAANMSAISDERLHFEEWLRHRAAAAGGKLEGLYDTEAGLFASRGLYGQYLRSILDHAMRQTAGHAQLRLLPDEIVDVEPADGGGFSLVCASGQRLEVAGVVLAVGNLPSEEGEDPRICSNAWDAKAWRKLDPDRPLMIIGTGLTMVDLVIGLRRRGYPGQIFALSRGGLLPTRHTAGGPWPTPMLTIAEERSLPLLMARLRQEIDQAAEQGVDWRAVIDSMRPITASLWVRFSLDERRRFLRHVRRYWDVHRHRMAPPHADQIDAMIAEGSLQVLAGRIQSMEKGIDCVRVTYQPKAGGSTQVIDVQRVIKASGLEHISRTRDPLMQRLLDRGLVRMDRQGMGLEVTDGLNVIGEGGEPAPRIWALGPIVRGVFWECVAVPDIRVQASHLAVSVVAWLREDAPRWSFAI
jgi:uncharacterized NAD(P)/FAD-binding protein YdhS